MRGLPARRLVVCVQASAWSYTPPLIPSPHAMRHAFELLAEAFQLAHLPADSRELFSNKPEESRAKRRRRVTVERAGQHPKPVQRKAE